MRRIFLSLCKSTKSDEGEEGKRGGEKGICKNLPDEGGAEVLPCVCLMIRNALLGESCQGQSSSSSYMSSFSDGDFCPSLSISNTAPPTNIDPAEGRSATSNNKPVTYTCEGMLRKCVE